PDTKEITYEIITNYRENSFDNLKIIDRPQGNQKLLKETIEVEELTIKSDGSIEYGANVEVDPVIDEDGTFTIEIGETNKAHRLTYKTSLKGIDNLEKTYKNIATVLDGDVEIDNLDASVDVYGERKYGSKNGLQDGKQVHWSIDVNIGQELVRNLKLEDTISDNQEY